MNRSERGFTLVELLVATSLTVCIAAAVFAAVHPTEGVFSVQSEAADMQQRLRVAATALSRDLAMAGAGIDAGLGSEPLIESFPPVLPYRPARTGGDGPGTFRTDAITLIYVPSLVAQTTTSTAMPARTAQVEVNTVPGCPVADSACGFSDDATAIVFDGRGSFDRFRIARVDHSRLELQHTLPDSSVTYPAGSRIVEAVSRSYFLRTDPQRATSRLMRDDGDGAAPVVDHVVQLVFDYFGDPRPPARPLPPEPGQQPTSYPPGENCLFVRDGASQASPRLAPLAPTAAGGLVRLNASQLTNGPWCPDSGAPNRFDADLLRVRKVVATIRVESAIDALRGPAGPLFSRKGTSNGGGRYLPDQTVRVEVTPRNMGFGR